MNPIEESKPIVKKVRAPKKAKVPEPIVIPEPVVRPLVAQSGEVKKVKKSKKVVVVPTPVATATVVKAKRVPSAYNLFVKEHMLKDDIKGLPSKERFSAISKLYQASKTVSA